MVANDVINLGNNHSQYLRYTFQYNCQYYFNNVSNILCTLHTHVAPSAPPSNVMVSNTFSRNMTIQWGTVPLIDQNGEITQYTIQYNPVDDKPRTNKTDAENEFYVAENLIPGKLYSIAVAASTRQGIGGFSEALFQRTLEESELCNKVYCCTIASRFTYFSLEVMGDFANLVFVFYT